MVDFTVYGEPRGKARPRVVRNRNGRTRAYTPQRTKDYESEIRNAYISAARGEIFQGAVAVTIIAVMMMSKSISKKARDKMLLSKILPTKKPDADNIAKVVCDALNGVAYRDDAQVSLLFVKKRYGDVPGINVRIWEE